MQLNTVIFDMDGVLIDSEPYWQEAGTEILLHYNISLTDLQYHSTTGLRTREWIDWWFSHFGIDSQFAKEAESAIVNKAIEKIRDHATELEGVQYIFDFFKKRKFKIGLATSSPRDLIEVVAEKLHIKNNLDGISSAEELLHSKPHPEVYLNCAAELGSSPLQCICFEDSFNGLIAAKAARMRCVAIPAMSQRTDPKWAFADLKLNSLLEFNDSLLKSLDE